MDKNVTILYVDDEPLNLMLFEINFKKKYEVLTADNAHDGLKILENNKQIPIVISDMKMPVMNGVEFLRIVKKHYPESACFIMTGFDLSDEIKHAISDSVVQKYLSKPINVKEIDEAIASSFNKDETLTN